jgi:mannose-1-phosphate guanylyltransferase
VIALIIAGGSGTRLWPLSTPDYPKHLLTINGGNDSLLQITYKRAKKIAKAVYVVSDASHIDHVKDQLSELDNAHFIVEPARRGTAGCILAALVAIQKDSDPEEPIAFLSADHYIRDMDGFSRSFKIAAATAKRTKNIVLVGVEPDHAATGFGYIEKGELFDDQNFVFRVSSFKEKPEYATAQKYLKSGNYLWNCGYFVGSINSFKTTMEADAPEFADDYKKLQAAYSESVEKFEEAYLSLKPNSIDYALIEKATNMLVVPASFDWMDLGSFADLHKSVDSDELGNHVHGNVEVEEVENSFIQNHGSKPVAVIGLDNIVVINSPNGILITRKDLSQKVGDVSKRIANKKEQA